MKLNLLDWNKVTAALRIAAKVSHAERDKPDCTPAANRMHYVAAQQFAALADKIEAEERS